MISLTAIEYPVRTKERSVERGKLDFVNLMERIVALLLRRLQSGLVVLSPSSSSTREEARGTFSPEMENGTDDGICDVSRFNGRISPALLPCSPSAPSEPGSMFRTLVKHSETCAEILSPDLCCISFLCRSSISLSHRPRDDRLRNPLTVSHEDRKTSQAAHSCHVDHITVPCRHSDAGVTYVGSEMYVCHLLNG